MKTAWPCVVLGLVVVLVLDLAGFDYDYEDDDEGDVAGAEFSNMLLEFPRQSRFGSGRFEFAVAR